MIPDSDPVRQGRRDLVEDCSSIAIGQILKASCNGRGGGDFVKAGHAGAVRPRVGFCLDVCADEPSLTLFYSNTERIQQQTIRLVRTRPHFGGQRWWFVCPVTGARVAKLYLPPGGRGFVGRRAAGLTYRSCRESGRYRAVLARAARSLDLTPAEVWQELRWGRGRGR